MSFVIAAEDSGGSFLVSPNVGLMIWTLVVFGLSMWFLGKFAFPRIQEALDKRQRAIEESIDASERARAEAAELLSEYRERLSAAREQADDIVARARPAQAGGGEGAHPPRHRAGDAASDPADPRRGGRSHRSRDREGHAQGA